MVLALPRLADKLNVVEQGLIDSYVRIMGLTGISSHAGSSVRQRYMKQITDLPATQRYDMKTLKGEIKPEAHIHMRV